MDYKIPYWKEAKNNSKRLLNIIVSLILATIVIIGGSSLAIPLLEYVKKSASENTQQYMIISHLAEFIPVALITIFIVKVIEGRKLTSIGLRKHKAFSLLVRGFVFGAVSFLLIVLILKLTGNIEVDKSVEITGVSAILPVILIIIVWFVQSGTEELVMRGWLLSSIGGKYNTTLAIIVTSIFFSLLHISGDITIVAIINITLVGILFGVYAIKANSIWCAIGYHTAWNWAQGSLFGFHVSGNNLTIPSILPFKSTGNTLLTGGDFGPEAGLIATAVITLGLILVLLKKRTNQYTDDYSEVVNKVSE